MFQPFLTDFIRSRPIRFSLILSIAFDIAFSRSIKHSLILFGLPYLISIALCCRFQPPKKRIRALISEQYRQVKCNTHKAQ